MQMAHKYQFITATRESEVCGKYALRLGDIQTVTFYNRMDGSRTQAIIFKQRSAKTLKGVQRHLSIPLAEEYEPWMPGLIDYLKKQINRSQDENRKVFRIAPRTLREYSKEAFNGLKIWIEAYQKIPGHWNNFSNHSLRHIRNSQLESEYGFDGIDQAIFFGWALSREAGMPRMARRYGNFYRNWARYFPKLLKPFDEKSFEILPGISLSSRSKS